MLRTVKRSLTRALSKVKERQVVEEELHANLQAGVSQGGGVRKVRMRSAVRTKAKATEHV
ncbi:hypothetical protein [uncultured Parabacteroides sp.]|uniref:hypothetical protein n=1 Tax=uncultured Parabacteroides sp. TaxID=512312 RepID=UPI0025DEDEF5|nr:hypothetical protein [uncultured Parabacteroides sp.]